MSLCLPQQLWGGDIGSVNTSQYRIVDNLTVTQNTDKPPYKVPSMAEIEALPWNGYNVISTFSGCGGSCLGYRMAGFKVRWASEFIPAAQEVYKLNHPDSILDTRDIRQVQPQEILDAIGLGVGEIDIMDGSPPCASFSTAGKLEAGWGKVKKYSDTQQRTDDLFFEYSRLVKGLQPKVFVAENVSGLVKGTAKGYFKMILQDLKDCGYTVTAKLLDAQWLGVPQMRQRIIFVGVRNDLVEEFGVKPAHPTPLSYQYTVRDALPWIMEMEMEMGKGFGEKETVGADTTPYMAIGTGPNSGNGLATKVLAARVMDDTGGQYSMGDVTDRPSPTVDTNPRLFVEKETDISRYAIGDEWEKMGRNGQTNSDKYINLKRPDLDAPSYGISQMGGQNPGVAAVTHPTEKRKFSIAELKRICAFPDDFQLTGSYAQQWERLGRAVPPVMMAAIAKAIQAEVLDRCAE